MTTYESLLARITDPGGRAVPDPATGEVVGRVALRSTDDLDRAVDSALAAQPAWAARADTDRIDLLLRAADAVEAAAEPLAELLSREQGKPLNGPNARFEVGACAAWLRATAATSLPAETVVDDGETHAELRYRPVGVVGAIGPWNWPMMITVWQVAPALRMGNTVVVKPSEYTPLSVLALVDVLNSVLPADVLTAVAGDREVGARLSGHPGVDKLVFTGSTATGQAIIRSSADTVKRLTLELGGNDAGIVLPDVDPRAIAEDLSGAPSSTPARPAPRSSACTCTTTSTTRSAPRSSTSRAPCPWAAGWTSATCWARCRTARSTTSSPAWSTRRGRPAPRCWSAVTPTSGPPGTSTR
jgi:acyl-CoA reductase-like NAD-dependent aldehyde dehydrogenase